MCLEADHDGALTMQILKMVSGGGQPTSLMDVRFKSEEGLLVLANCGASASFSLRNRLKPGTTGNELV